MAKKCLMAALVLASTLLILGVAVASSSLVLKVGETQVGQNGAFDFYNQNVLVTNDYGVNDTTVRVYKNNVLLNVPSAVGLDAEQAFTLNMTKHGFVAGNSLVFETLDVGGVLIGNTSISVNPQAPTFSNFVASKDHPIKGDNLTFSIDIVDPSGIKADTVVAHISVPVGCASLTDADKSLVKKTGTDNTYEYVNYALENACTYSFNFSAADIYGTAGASSGHSTTVYGKVADSLADVVADLIVSTDDGLNFVLSSDNSGAFAETLAYNFDLDQDTYGIHDISFSFANSTDTKTITSDELSVANLDSASGLNHISALKDGFEVKISSAPNGKACFFGDSKPVEKDTILYCGAGAIADCNGEWKLEKIDLATGCMKNSRTIGSFFVLATCAGDYWYDAECNTVLESGGDNEGGGNSVTGSTTKETKTEPKKKTTKDLKAEEVDTKGNETIDESSTSEGGILTGLGTFFTENTGTTISIGVAVILIAGMVYFTMYELKKRKKLHGAAPLAEEKSAKDKKDKKDKDRPTVHELAKKHDMHKPGDSTKDAKKLKDFIEVAMMMGHDASDLKDALKYRGWDEGTVDSVFKEVNFKK